MLNKIIVLKKKKKKDFGISKYHLNSYDCCSFTSCEISLMKFFFLSIPLKHSLTVTTKQTSTIRDGLLVELYPQQIEYIV